MDLMQLVRRAMDAIKILMLVCMQFITHSLLFIVSLYHYPSVIIIHLNKYISAVDQA